MNKYCELNNFGLGLVINEDMILIRTESINLLIESELIIA